jgi:hypothetical protein
MKFKAHGVMRSNPGVALANEISPIAFSTQIQGTLGAQVGAISVGIGKIPVRVRIPFLKDRPPQVIGSVGGVGIKVDPFTLSIKELRLHCDGLLGSKGITVTTEGKVDCRTEMDLEGILSGSLGMGSISLGAEPARAPTITRRSKKSRA